MLADLMQALRAFACDEEGQDVVEFGLLIGSIVLVVLLGTSAFGSLIKPWFEQLAARITTVGT